jgi:RecA/RadA recombinase
MARKSKAEVAEDHVYRPDMLSLLADLEQVVKINAISLGAEDRMSTGVLALDLILGGGVCPGMYTMVGPEQSAKTTAAITMLAASVSQSVGLRTLWDAENSSGSSIDYLTNIFQTVGAKVTTENLFGIRKGSEYVVPPIVYYQDDPSADTFFNWLHGLEKRLPDKRMADDQWWYVYPSDPKTKARLEKHASKIDKVMSRKQGSGLWIPAEDGRLQAIVLIDSYPSLVPTSMDEDEADNSIAVQARMFSKHLPRVKGNLRAKRIALIGVNQLSINPMARFSNPETEKGGGSLKYFSDVRLRMFPRSSGQPYNPKIEKAHEHEPSLWGSAEDRFRYIHVSTLKNKLSVPGRETWLRLVVRDGSGKARGFDPVWDTFHYLMETGQASGKRSAIKLNVKGLPETTKPITWMEFKALILGSLEQKTAVAQKLGWPKAPNLRGGCFSQVRKGIAEDLYVAKHGVGKPGIEDDDDDDDDDKGDDI